MQTVHFKHQSEKEWKQAAKKLLKGKPFRETLYTETNEGITIKPIYFPEDRPDIGKIVNHTGWYIAQTLFKNNAGFNKLAREVLQKGQTALNMNLDAASQLGMNSEQTSNHSLHIRDYESLAALLDGIDLQNVPIFFNALNTSELMHQWLVELSREKGLNAAHLKVALGADPVSAALLYGGFKIPVYESLKSLAPLLKQTNSSPGWDIFTIHADIIHNSGGHKIHELAYALSCIVTYVNQLMDLGVQPEISLKSIRIKLAVANDQFMEIAKLRSMRLLWQNICDAYKVEHIDAKIDVVTSWRFLSDRDVHTNMIRATGQAFSAIAGGCDSLDVLPFDLAIKNPDTFSLRHARNLQIILAEEAHLNKVEDPACGSGYLDKLTVELAEKSWQYFQWIEEQGGLIKLIQSGKFQSDIKVNAKKQDKAFKDSLTKVIGVNCYQNKLEMSEDRQFRQNYYDQVKLFNEVEQSVIRRLVSS